MSAGVTPTAAELRVARERMLANPCASKWKGCLARSSDWRDPMCPRCTAVAVLDSLAAAEQDNERLRETNRKLNRRATGAEAVVMQTVEDCKRQGVSVGRALANMACNSLEERAHRAEARVTELERALERAAYVARNLHGMIDRETWRAHGAEWQGQYEGDHHAEQAAEEIESWAVLGSRPHQEQDA